MRFFIVLMLLAGQVFARDFYSIKDKFIQGGEFDSSTLKGKVVLVVNIASQCGYTKQMSTLESLYQKFKDKNFVVLGVPTNDFGGQTPEDDKAMMEFCQKNYSASFPILSKSTIKGKQKRDLYKFLTEETAKPLRGEVSWNFEKFLVNKKGEVVERMKPSLDPLDEEMIKKVTAQL